MRNEGNLSMNKDQALVAFEKHAIRRYFDGDAISGTPYLIIEAE